MEALNEVKRALKLILIIDLIIFVSFLVASYFLAMYLGPTFFFFTPLSTQYSPNSLITGLPIQLFFMVTFVVPTKLNVGTVFLFLWATFLLCFVAAWKLKESFHKVIKNSLSTPVSYTFKNFLFAMPIITSMVLTAVVAIHTFQEAHGVPTGQLPLPEDRFVRFFGLTYASLMEEIGFRITPMYALLIPYLFWAGRRKDETKTWTQRFKFSF